MITSAIILVTKPFTLFKQACLFGMKTISMFFHTWTELIMTAVYFHLIVFQKMIAWIVAFVSLPLQVVTALHRERQLELQLRDMRIRLENLAWDRKELLEHLQAAIREHKMMESMVAELEDKHDKAIVKLEQLEDELQDLKRENLRLREVQGKDYWSFKGQDDKDSSTKIGVSEKNGTPYRIPSRDSSHNGNGISFEDLFMNTTTWGDKSKTKTEVWNLLKSGSEAIAPIHPITAVIASRSSDMIEALVKRREVAMSQSIFSAFLSLSVGMIIWKAEDPCMPLIVALFTVVGMSLKSVVQFFSTIKNKPASDAVALLSFNWFLLGTLTYPTLPVIAHILFPLGSRFWDQLIKWRAFLA